ncbi:MAG: DNA-binding response regulator [Acidobacteria bacterium]|nr:MAG: DNA-binding response regulator [Acidobacteriota bacterium]
MSHILIAEDDRDIADLVRHYLVRAGYTAEVVPSGEQVLQRVGGRRPDLLVLDLMLPGLHGLEVCRALRGDRATADLPIIIVTARAEEADRVAGLELGADDYVTKPFSPKELVARVGALLRRTKRTETAGAGPLQYGAITLDREHHQVADAGREVTLTAKEFLLLEYLMRHPGRVLSRDRLLTEVWGYQYTGGTRTVDVHVRRLREKLPLLVAALVTVKQFGYKLSDPLPDGEGESTQG